MTLNPIPLHPLIGAEITGLDLRETPGPALCAEIDAAMERHAVLVFRDQQLDDDRQMAFGEALGPLEQTLGGVDLHRLRLGHQKIADISNIDVDGSLLAADDRRRMFNLGNQLWHSDSSYKPTPAKYSMLHGRVIPPEGGETEFADMRAAWDTLPPKLQARLRPLVAEHSLLFSRAQLGFTDYSAEERQGFAPVRQRLVRWHPVQQRHSLYLSSHIGGIVGMLVPEALALIRQLMEAATDRSLVYAHRWRPLDLVMWDNRTTMHRARPFEDHTYPRDVRRVTLADVAPTLEQPAPVTP